MRSPNVVTFSSFQCSLQASTDLMRIDCHAEPDRRGQHHVEEQKCPRNNSTNRTSQCDVPCCRGFPGGDKRFVRREWAEATAMPCDLGTGNYRRTLETLKVESEFVETSMPRAPLSSTAP